MEEVWKIIPEFPTYAISNYGEVLNELTGRYMKKNLNMHGTVKVGLNKDGMQHTRSVRVLVAEAFVEGRTPIYDTPIHLDGNQDNVRADNLAWRPRWFAWEYVRQFEFESENDHIGPLREINSGNIYRDVYEVATTHGFLFRDVRRSFAMKETVFPTLLRFELL